MYWFNVCYYQVVVMNINFLVFCVIEGYVDIEWVGCVCVDKFKKCVY